MFDRILRRSPRVGSEVTVLAGPYARFTGRISEVDYTGRFRVFIDDCCQPVLDATELVVGMPGNVDELIAARRASRQNPIVRSAA